MLAEVRALARKVDALTQDKLPAIENKVDRVLELQDKVNRV